MQRLDHPPPKIKNDDTRVIDVRVGELLARLAEIIDTREPPPPEPEVLDRTGAAKFLIVSLSKLDALCRREADPVPFHLCGDSRRFLRADLIAWLRRQR